MAYYECSIVIQLMNFKLMFGKSSLIEQFILFEIVTTKVFIEFWLLLPAYRQISCSTRHEPNIFIPKMIQSCVWCPTTFIPKFFALFCRQQNKNLINYLFMESNIDIQIQKRVKCKSHSHFASLHIYLNWILHFNSKFYCIHWTFLWMKLRNWNCELLSFALQSFVQSFDWICLSSWES